MLGFAGPSCIKKLAFMSFVPIVRSESPYFFYLTFEFSLHCVRYVLVHALLLMAWYLMGHCFGTAFSCRTTQAVFSQWHRILSCCMLATCGLFVRRNGALVTKWCCRLCDMLWPRNSYNFVRVYVLTPGRALRSIAFARR